MLDYDRQSGSAIFAAAALGVVLAVGLPVAAQTGPGDGRALDNNLQRGAGGVNQQQSTPNYQARNNLVTGNVGGLGYFHDRVGYRSPGDFQGQSSDDALFRFRAQSLSPSGYQPYSVAGYGGVVGSGYGGGYGGSGDQSVYRSFAPSSMNDVRQGGQSLVPTFSDVVIRRPDSAGQTFSSPASSTLLSGLSGQSQLGQDAGVTMSPLLGIRRVEPRTRAGLLDEVPAPGAEVQPDRPVTERVNPQDRTLSPNTGTQPEFERMPGGLTLALGRQIQARQAAPRAEAVETLDDRVARLEAAMFSPLGQREAKPGDDVYMDLLRGVRENLQVARGQKPPAPLPGDTLVARPELQAGKKPEVTLTPPTQKELAEAEAQRDAATRAARGLRAEGEIRPWERRPVGDGGIGDGAGGQPGDGGVGGTGAPGDMGAMPRGDDSALDPAMRDLVAALRKDPQVLATLAGQRDTVVNRILREAEGDLAGGRYFDAENKYRHVLTLVPDYPPASLGLVHAQLGAGMVKSAATNLRQLFEDHPEMIAVRYDAKLLPHAKRVEWIRDQLMNHIDTSERLTDAALLLAYLGYQFNTPKLVQYGLDVTEARTPQDPLLPVLQRLWLPQPDKQGDADKQRQPNEHRTPSAPAPAQ